MDSGGVKTFRERHCGEMDYLKITSQRNKMFVYFTMKDQFNNTSFTAKVHIENTKGITKQQGKDSY